MSELIHSLSKLPPSMLAFIFIDEENLNKLHEALRSESHPHPSL